jgi:hypothetical protein
MNAEEALSYVSCGIPSKRADRTAADEAAAALAAEVVKLRAIEAHLRELLNKQQQGSGPR